MTLLESVVPQSIRNIAHQVGPHGNSDKRDQVHQDHNADPHPNDPKDCGQSMSYRYDGGISQAEVLSLMFEYEDKKPPSPHELVANTTGKRLGRPASLSIEDFNLLKTLGTGTFARVWLAKPKFHDNAKQTRVCAVKVLRKADVIQLKQVEHVQNERSTLAAASGHPFINSLFCTFRDGDRIYLCMAYSAGGELFTYLRRRKRFDQDTARFYAAEMTLIFEFLHENLGIVYRDLKPENILLDAKGHIKLVDFGFAKKIGNKETYTLCGTPEYLAPEVIKNTGHGMGTDWWALGILIYEFLVGQPPFWDKDPLKIYHRIVENKLKFPTSNELSDSAKDIITQLLQTSQSRRLGCIAGGARTVKEHPWFSGTAWDELYNKSMDGPIVPKVVNAEDGANFDDYPEEDIKARKEYSERMQKQWDSAFADF